MNAAARLMQQSVISRSWILSFVLSRVQTSFIVLIAALLVSALSMIYVTNVSRSLNANIQQTLFERNKLHIAWGQLLLEKSTLTMQTRVEKLAEQEMGMQIPDHQSVVIVNE